MRKRNIKFVLLLKDNKPVRTIEELQTFYESEKILQYFQNGQLIRWLEQRGYNEELGKIEELKRVDEEFLKSSLKNVLINTSFNPIKDNEKSREDSDQNRVIHKKNSVLMRREESNSVLNERPFTDNSESNISESLKSVLNVEGKHEEHKEKNSSIHELAKEEVLTENNHISGEENLTENNHVDEKENYTVNHNESNYVEIDNGVVENNETSLDNLEEVESEVASDTLNKSQTELIGGISRGLLSKESNKESVKTSIGNGIVDMGGGLSKPSTGLNDKKLQSTKSSLNINLNLNVGNPIKENHVAKLNEGIKPSLIKANIGSGISLGEKSVSPEDSKVDKQRIGLMKKPFNLNSSILDNKECLDEKVNLINEDIQNEIVEEVKVKEEIEEIKKETVEKADLGTQSLNKQVEDKKIEDEFDINKISEFITDPSIVETLKNFYLSNKDIKLKTKPKESKVLNEQENKTIIEDKKVEECNLNSVNISKEEKIKLPQNDENTNGSSIIKSTETSQNTENTAYNYDFNRANKLKENRKEEPIKENKGIGSVFNHLFKKNLKSPEKQESEVKTIRKEVKGKITVHSQEEYRDALEHRANCEEILYVNVECNNLEVSDKDKNIKYVGVNNPSIFITGSRIFDGRKNNISFSNLNITSKAKINFTAEKLEGCLINKDIIKKDISDLLISHPNILAEVEECYFLKESFEDTGIEESKSLQSFIRNIYKGEKDFSEVVATVKYEGVSVFTNLTMGIVDKAFYKTEEDTYEDVSDIFQNMEPIDIFKRDGEVALLLKALISKENLEVLGNIKGKKYKGPKDAIWDLFKNNELEQYLEYIMLIPIKIFKQGMPINRKEQIRLIELMNIDTGIPFIYRAFSGKRENVEKDLYSFVQEASLNRNEYNIHFKGVVVEILDQELREKLGVKDGKSNFETMFKFKSEVHKTRVRDVYFSLDENKTLIPMLEIDPIVTSKRTVNTISIKDPRKLKELYLRLNDVVLVGVQEGEEPIIMKDEQLSQNNKNALISIPDFCPSCGTQLSVKDLGEFGKCENPECKGAVAYTIYNKLVSINITVIPFNVINLLVKEGYINELDDLCKIYPEELARISEARQEEIEQAINIIQYMNKEV
ncbi:hypothetical protein ACOAKC_05365 [Hathewaya histolytica]|uniref:hypothetical protein n=1 Tax=Hathewaya histolytica TaxID=1498 RepID=UPI003B671380